MTDKQFERMQIFHGKMKKTPEKPMTQLTLF
jgi:CRISPR/Cas system-associated protein endoribonuclease Cas2